MITVENFKKQMDYSKLGLKDLIVMVQHKNLFTIQTMLECAHARSEATVASRAFRVGFGFKIDKMSGLIR